MKKYFIVLFCLIAGSLLLAQLVPGNYRRLVGNPITVIPITYGCDSSNYWNITTNTPRSTYIETMAGGIHYSAIATAEFEAGIGMLIDFGEPGLGGAKDTLLYVSIQNNATSGSATNLTDTTQNWGANALLGYTGYLLSGTGAGVNFTVTSNTANTLYFADISTNIDATTRYAVDIDWDDDSGTGPNSQCDFTTPVTGTYTIEGTFYTGGATGEVCMVCQYDYMEPQGSIWANSDIFGKGLINQPPDGAVGIPYYRYVDVYAVSNVSAVWIEYTNAPAATNKLHWFTSGALPTGLSGAVNPTNPCRYDITGTPTTVGTNVVNFEVRYNDLYMQDSDFTFRVFNPLMISNVVELNSNLTAQGWANISGVLLPCGYVRSGSYYTLYTSPYMKSTTPVYGVGVDIAGVGLINYWNPSAPANWVLNLQAAGMVAYWTNAAAAYTPVEGEYPWWQGGVYGWATPTNITLQIYTP